jgi:hypothetical protein
MKHAGNPTLIIREDNPMLRSLRSQPIGIQ